MVINNNYDDNSNDDKRDIKNDSGSDSDNDNDDDDDIYKNTTNTTTTTTITTTTSTTTTAAATATTTIITTTTTTITTTTTTTTTATTTTTTTTTDNMISGINAWTVSVLRYRAGVVDLTVKERVSMDRKTRKILAINGCMHTRSNIARVYLPRKEGGRGPISIEKCVRKEIYTFLNTITGSGLTRL